MRRAVKWGLLATLVAVAGAGAYHFTSGGRTSFWRFFADGAPNAGLVAEQSSTDNGELSKSDLDAVASAWAGTESAQSVNPSTAVAADGDDRYAVVEPTPVELPAAREVTRGQEPSTDDKPNDDTIDADGAKTGPNPFGGKPSSDRAREAFEAMAPTSLSSTGDRYGLAAAEPNRDPIDASVKESSVNPFESPADRAPTKPADDDSPSRLADSEPREPGSSPESVRRRTIASVACRDRTAHFRSTANRSARRTTGQAGRVSEPSKGRKSRPW
jgi:hypothetical protein